MRLRERCHARYPAISAMDDWFYDYAPDLTRAAEIDIIIEELLDEEIEQPWVPLRVPEMRRLFWRLVLATKQAMGQMLDWPAWRRWHQGMAPYAHDKRRAGPEVQL